MKKDVASVCVAWGWVVLLWFCYCLFGVFWFCLFFFPVVELEHTSSQMLGRDSASELQALSPDIAT